MCDRKKQPHNGETLTDRVTFFSAEMRTAPYIASIAWH